jgi:hypothetical protein
MVLLTIGQIKNLNSPLFHQETHYVNNVEIPMN